MIDAKPNYDKFIASAGIRIVKRKPTEEPSPEGKRKDRLIDYLTPKAATTQLDLTGDLRASVLELAFEIADRHLSPKGREDKPHVTVLDGLTDADPSAVANLVEGFGPITVTLGKTSLFEGDEHDVVKIEVDSLRLRELNKRLAKLDHKSSHPDYQPHITLAYVNPGAGDRYAGNATLEGQTQTFDKLVFVSDGKVSKIDLREKPQPIEPEPKPEPKPEPNPAPKPKKYQKPEPRIDPDKMAKTIASSVSESVGKAIADSMSQVVEAIKSQPKPEAKPEGKRKSKAWKNSAGEWIIESE